MERITSQDHISIRTEGESKKYQLYRKIVFSTLALMTKGRLNVTLPGGETITFGNSPQELSANIVINNNNFFRNVVLYGDIGFGESYVAGDWDTDDIVKVISWMILNVDTNPSVSGEKARNIMSPLNLMKYFNKLFHKFNSNTRRGSKKNISDHYDLNNDFFSLWLDKSMSYSSAVFKNESDDLYTAQIEKYDRICRKLKLKASDSVLEIGSGWGGFCTYAAEKYGCSVTTVTISEEQYKYTVALIKQKNLEHKITPLIQDYRDITGQYDKIVSIEMLEAVGHEYLPAYFSKLNDVLKKDGAVALQVITSHDSNYDKLRKGVDWIQKHIFPGSLLPSVGAVNSAVNKTGNLHLHDLKSFGLDYARTLREWRLQFNSHLDEVFRLKFDGRFVRKWNYYLSYCEAAFASRNISVVQMIYTRPNNRNL